MNAALTLSSLTFNLSYSDKSGSERREISRGVNLPEVLSIKHQPYVDSATKLPGTRSVARIDRYVAISDGRIVPVSFYIVGAVPQDALITSSDVLACTERLVSLIQEDDAGLDLADEIFINHEQ